MNFVGWSFFTQSLLFIPTIYWKKGSLGKMRMEKETSDIMIQLNSNKRYCNLPHLNQLMKLIDSLQDLFFC